MNTSRTKRTARAALTGVALVGLTAAGLALAAPASASTPVPATFASSAVALAAVTPTGNITQPEAQTGAPGDVVYFSASNTAGKNGYGWVITAPTGTTLESVTNSKIVYEFNADRTVATSNQPFEAGATITVGVKIPNDATPGTVYGDGTIDVINKSGGVSNRAVLSLNAVATPEAEFEVLTPAPSEDTSLPQDGAFTGKGQPGTTIVITDKNGDVVGEGTVGEDGTWSIPLTGIQQGPNNLTVTATTPAGKTLVNDLGPITIIDAAEGTPLMDPTIAGGALLAMFAAAGTALVIRRRTVNITN
ncbi:Ig-like domain-containing protein [Leifsonia aquatica]|uniref:Ig-like domain-containing protein n=1 Tax=Leifsonia aquatica TaxID=144185 RepID=UPI00381E34A1